MGIQDIKDAEYDLTSEQKKELVASLAQNQVFLDKISDSNRRFRLYSHRNPGEFVACALTDSLNEKGYLCLCSDREENIEDAQTILEKMSGLNLTELRR